MVYSKQRRFFRAVSSWLRSEARGDARRAERELRDVFVRLGRPAPGPGFVGETMKRLGFETDLAHSPEPGVWFKLLVAGCLSAAGAAMLLVPSALAPLLTALGPAVVVQWWTTVIVGVSQRIASGLAVWKVLAEIGDTVAAVLASPASLVALSAAIVISCVTFRVLSGLVSIERGTQNA